YGLTQVPPLASPVPMNSAAVVSITGAGTMAIMFAAGAGFVTRGGASAACCGGVDRAGMNGFVAAMAHVAVRVAVAISRAGFLMEPPKHNLKRGPQARSAGIARARSGYHRPLQCRWRVNGFTSGPIFLFTASLVAILRAGL